MYAPEPVRSLTSVFAPRSRIEIGTYDPQGALTVDDICHHCWPRGSTAGQVLNELKLQILAAGGVHSPLVSPPKRLGLAGGEGSSSFLALLASPG